MSQYCAIKWRGGGGGGGGGGTINERGGNREAGGSVTPAPLPLTYWLIDSLGAIIHPHTSLIIIQRKIDLLFVNLLVLPKMWQRNEYEDGLLCRHLQQRPEVPG